MKTDTVKALSENVNYTAINLGCLDSLMEHSLIHPKSGQHISGKVFTKDATNATGTEISFQILPPKTDLSYFHIHYNNEETYVILRGEGFFQIDDDCFPIVEGSIVRVAPAGQRGLCNSSDTPMIYMVIQSKEGSLGKHTTEDGERVICTPKWSYNK